jgi:hypothetical protein
MSERRLLDVALTVYRSIFKLLEKWMREVHTSMQKFADNATNKIEEMDQRIDSMKSQYR